MAELVKSLKDEPDELISISRTHMVEGENLLRQGVL